MLARFHWYDLLSALPANTKLDPPALPEQQRSHNKWAPSHGVPNTRNMLVCYQAERTDISGGTNFGARLLVALV